jgi:hypothetical protein
MQLRELVILQMTADASGLGQHRERPGNSEHAVIHGRPHGRIDLLGRGIEPAGREHTDPARGQAREDPLQHGLLFGQRQMPDAVPGRDEVERSREFPAAHVGVMERDAGMPFLRQSDHPGGGINAFDLKSVAHEEIDDPAIAAAPEVEGPPFLLDESEGPLMLRDAVGAGKLAAVPQAGDLVVAPGDIVRMHGSFAHPVRPGTAIAAEGE